MTPIVCSWNLPAAALMAVSLLLSAFPGLAAAREPGATPAETLKVAPGFQVELLYSVPKEEQGSWVNLCVDPQGRLIVSDQYGKLYRVTLPEGERAIQIEPITAPIGEAQGLLWAFDALYVVVNKGKDFESGLYRVTDSDGDDQLDAVEQLRKIEGDSEHGPHAVLLSPDGESLTIICGNRTHVPALASSRVPQVWDEDIMLPRSYGKGFMKGVPAPGGFVARTDPDGKEWELIATGFRNEYDAAYNRDNELFAYDADMEWDMNTPWYRPTRVCHVVSGGEWGWRNGSGKWPVYYSDSLSPVANVGPGSPTGVTFGYGAKFPSKYEQALYLCDWSYGKMYALHMSPSGASYTGTLEEFVTGTPLPLTDVVINPKDGAMYFAVGGRKVQSGLYRVTFTGEQPEAESQDVAAAEQAALLRAQRRDLEALHQPKEGSVDAAWPALSHEDRFIRFAARIALEHQPVEQWEERAFAETDPQAALAALMARVRQQPSAEALQTEIHDPVLPTYGETVAPQGDNPELQAKLQAALDRFAWNDLTAEQKLDWLRVYELTFCRLGPPTDAATREALLAKFEPLFPAANQAENSELLQILVYLQSPHVAPAAVELMVNAPTQEEQLDYMRSLRHLTAGWTLPAQEAYFGWFQHAARYRGGANFTMFVDEMKADAVAHLGDEAKGGLREILETRPAETSPVIATTLRPLVKEWKMDDAWPLFEEGLSGRDFARGKRLFADAGCFACHRFDNEGGAVGPDLTSLAGRFGPRDILESVLDPSKVVSDQYAAVQIQTTGGEVVVGRIVNLNGEKVMVNTNMLDPNAQTVVDVREIETMIPSKTSMMPQGLLNSLHQEELLDLMAYLLSRGDAKSPMFAQGESTVAAPEGFTALFNGVDLTGWHGMPHFNPNELEALPAEEREAKIAAWTEDARQHWSADNGELVNDGFGAYLTSDQSFGNYELLIDYKTVPKADSGIYLKATPQVQIWDSTEERQFKLGADKGSGGLWNNSAGAPGKDPLVLADRPFGEWNSFRIIQVGARTSVWLNDQPVVDHAILENFWDKERKSPLRATGPIQLQTHGGEIRWRNIFVREIGAEEANALLASKGNDGFESLFDGKSLDGWQGATENYEVVDGAIRCKKGHGGVLHTPDEYADFVVRIEFRLPPGGNNGLAIRYPGEGDTAYVGMCELQVLDTEHPKYAKLDPRQVHGSAYGMIPAARGYLRPTGEWNFQEVTVRGSTIKVELNGNVILNGDLSTVTEFMANSPHPGKDNPKGYFGFAGHNDPVEFRNVYIKSLAE